MVLCLVTLTDIQTRRTGLSASAELLVCVIVFYYMFMCVSCYVLVVSTCRMIGYRKTPLMTPS